MLTLIQNSLARWAADATGEHHHTTSTTAVTTAVKGSKKRKGATESTTVVEHGGADVDKIISVHTAVELLSAYIGFKSPQDYVSTIYFLVHSYLQYNIFSDLN